MVNDKTLCSIRSLADYVIDNKIEGLFDSALTVRKWLDADCMAFGTCPNCKKESVEICGEGITGDGRHYPLEQCLWCDTEDLEVQNTKDVVIKGKGYFFEVDYDDGEISGLRLTEGPGPHCMDNSRRELSSKSAG